MSQRNKLLAQINIAKKQLGMDEETYRAFLGNTLEGVQSLKDVTDTQLRAVIAQLKAKGFKTSKPNSARRYDKATSRKLQALWITLGEAGIIKSKTDKALREWCKTACNRSTSLPSLDWLSGAEASRCIEALKAKLPEEN